MPSLGHNIPNALAAQTLAAPAAAEAGSGGGGALTAQYLTLAADVHLTSERIFTAGSGLGGVDSGAGLPYTLSVDASVARNTWAINAGAGLTGGGNLAAAGITLDVGAGSGISVAANSIAVDPTFAFAWTGLQTWSQLAVFNAGARITAGQALQFGTDVSLDRKGADILELGLGDNVESRTYTSGLAGWLLGADGSAEFENVRVRGELSASVFRISEITATAGTLGVFKSAATLYVDYTAPGSIGSSNTLTARNSLAAGSLLAATDRIRIKAWDGSAIRDLWLSVTSVGTNHGDNTDYTVKLESGTTGVTFTAGTAIADYGPSAAGFITLSADGTVGSSANVSVADHVGSPWSATTLRARLGNLNGSFGIATDQYGFGVGDFSGGNYLRYDPTNGFVLQAGGGTVNIDGSGIGITVGSAVANVGSVSFYTPLSGASVPMGYLSGFETGSADDIRIILQAQGTLESNMLLSSRATANKKSQLTITAQNPGAGAASLYLTATAANVGLAWIGNNTDGGSHTFSGLVVGAASLSLPIAAGATLDVRGSAIVTGGLNLGTGTGSSAGGIIAQSAAAYNPQFNLMNTTNDASAGYVILRKNRTATINDALGTLLWQGNNSTPAVINYASITASAGTVTAGSERGVIDFTACEAGAAGNRMRIFGSSVFMYGGVNIGSATGAGVGAIFGSGLMWAQGNFYAGAVTALQVVGPRKVGYTNAWVTTAAERATARDAATITLVQLAQRVRALQDDLTSHGLIGP